VNTSDALTAALGALPAGITVPDVADSARLVDPAEIRADQIAERLSELIPPLWTDATASHPDIAAWADRVAAGDTCSLLLVGLVGRGKSHQAYGALRRIVERSWPRSLSIVAGPAPDLLDDARPSPGVDGREVIRRYREADVLMLDDVGAEKGSDWVGEQLYRILDYRYRYLRPTLVVSNLPPEAPREANIHTLAAHLGDRLFSRLCQMCQTVVITGPDRRRAAR